MRAEGAPEIFWGKMDVFKGENAQKHTFLRPNRYFFRDPNLRKIKTPGYFFRDPNLRKIKTPDDFPGFQTLRGGFLFSIPRYSILL